MIRGKDVSRKIRGFGISFSQTADLDDNKVKDFAVGKSVFLFS